jgi:hypothetical protein
MGKQIVCQVSDRLHGAFRSLLGFGPLGVHRTRSTVRVGDSLALGRPGCC